MKVVFALLLVFSIASPSMCYIEGKSNVSNDFNILKYGAKGDGHTDDSDAFLKAFQDACSSTQGTPTIIVPTGIFMTQPLSFEGPCKSEPVNFMITGTITAPQNREDWKWSNKNDQKNTWITFSHITGLVVNGGGTINGQGSSWWDQDQGDRPTTLRFLECDNVKHGPITQMNSPRNHISITGCKGALITDVHLIAPETSPNTDGVDISTSSNIVIEHSTISTGDDCVAINTNSKQIRITDVNCGPGHGISVGSLGKDGEFANVEDVHVSNITFTRTTNGARIKTWQGGSGYARNITYEDVKLVDVRNPIIIDQKYTDVLLKAGGGAVKVSDVTFRNFLGTSKDENAIELNCDTVGCSNIVLEEVDITGFNGVKTISSCINARGTFSSCTPTVECRPSPFMKNSR